MWKKLSNLTFYDTIKLEAFNKLSTTENLMIKIRRSRNNELSKILNLLEQEYGRPFTREEWIWKYDKNKSFGQSIYWVAELDNIIVGGRGAIPLLLNVGDKELTIGHSVDRSEEHT